MLILVNSEQITFFKISDHDERSRYICLDCSQQLKIGHHIWKKIRNAELRHYPVTTNNDAPSGHNEGSIDEVYILDTKSEQEQIDTDESSSENKDVYLYEYLEDEFITDDGANSTSKADSDPDASHAPKSLPDSKPSIENYKKLSLQRTFRKTRFEMPKAEVVLRITDLLDHLVVDVKGDRCCGCSFVGANRRELLQHSTSAHSIEIEGTGNYCPICFYKFATETSLTKHIDECKSKSIFVCKNCEKYFNRQHQIEAHLENCKKTDLGW